VQVGFGVQQSPSAGSRSRMANGDVARIPHGGTHRSFHVLRSDAAAQIVIACVAHDGAGDREAHVAQLALVRVDGAEIETFLTDESRQRDRCQVEHFRADFLGFGDGRAETYAGENEYVVRLADDVAFAAIFNVGEGTARGRDGATAGPSDGFFRRALCLGRRIAEREHNRSLHMTRHALEHRLGERARRVPSRRR
jgi:hypothetical protein